MYYRIEKSGCCERKGLIQIRFDCYLSREDPGNEQHYITVPDIPIEGYPGDVDKDGRPVDYEDFKKWLDTLPTKQQNNPFCCHFRLFQPDVRDEDIVKAGDEILQMAYENFQVGDLKRNHNPGITADASKASLIEAKIASVLAKDFTTVADAGSLIRGVRLS